MDPRALCTAARDEVAVSFAYEDKTGQGTRRAVNPPGVYYFDQVHCLLAWSDIRSFRLDRISDLLVPDDSVRPRRVPLLRTFVAQIRT